MVIFSWSSSQIPSVAVRACGGPEGCERPDAKADTVVLAKMLEGGVGGVSLRRFAGLCG